MDIIHYEKRKLVHYTGNLSEFVKVKPEAKAYYELSAASFKFTFPEPGFLDGVKGKRQPVIRVSKMSFQYPGAAKPQISDVTVRCTLGSRIGVLGRGAGEVRAAWPGGGKGAQAVAFGLPEEEALKGLTLYTAEILGLGVWNSSVSAPPTQCSS